jgi:tight adherence protein B
VRGATASAREDGLNAAKVAVLAGLAGLALLALLAWPAAALARPAGAAGPARAGATVRVAFILLDTNVSPSPARIPAEQRQAMTYASALPPDVEVGLIVFGDGWHVALQPTANRPALATAVAAVKPAGATSAGIRAALTGAAAEIGQLGGSARSRMLVLSNGESLVRPLAAQPIPVDVVTTSYDSDDYPGTLRHLAAASDGRVGGPGTPGLAGLARMFGPPPKPPAPPPAAPSPRPAASAVPPWRLSRALIGVLAVVFAALFVLALLVVRSVRPGDRRPHLAGQIERYGPRASAAVAEHDSEGKVARTAVGLMAQVLSSRQSEPRLALRLDRAGISRQPAEWALLGVCVCVTLAAALALLASNAVLGILIGVLAGWAGMRVTLSVKISRRRAAFDEQLPGVLQLVASSIQSGFSLAQAFDAVVREDTQPASGEFARALAETRLGVDLADALEGVANRLQSADLTWVVMAIRIQRETGGNLAEVLRNTVATMRERAYLRRQVRTLSAEGRLSAYILVALPILVGGWLFYSDPTYMRPLYTTFLGIAMLVTASTLVVVGAFWMRRLIDVEV